MATARPTRRPGTRTVALLAVAVVAALAVLAGCSGDRKVDLTKAEPGLRKVIADKWFPSLDVGAVTCPAKAVAREKGKVSECTVEVEKVPVKFKVVQTNDGGGIVPGRFEAILATAKAEDFIRRTVRDLATVDCGTAPYFVRAPGAQFSCDVTATNGRQAKIYYEVTDPKGNIKFVRNT